MHSFLTDFINLLRGHGVRISTSETIDAAQTLKLIGYEDRNALRIALAAAVAKTRPEQEIFQECFDAYFSFMQFAEKDKAEHSIDPAIKEDLSPLSRMLLENDRAALMEALAAAGDAVKVNDIFWPTQKGLVQSEILKTMGIGALDADIASQKKGGEGSIATALADQREQLVEQVNQFIEARYELYGKTRMEQVFEGQLMHQGLSAQISESDFERMNVIVRKIVKRMKDVHSRRKKRFKQGVLDVKRTIRMNLKYNEVPFHLHWKRKKIEHSNLVVICDISRSMRWVVRFFLTLLYSLNREVVHIRSFAFCSNLAEVSHLFDLYGISEGVARLETGYDCNIMMARTDYGRAFRDFVELYGDCLSDRTTVIILGDGRNNFGDPEAGILKMIGERAKRVVWLNPEVPTYWGTGDSAMKQYMPFCHEVLECKTLYQLERAIDSLLS